MHDWLDLYLIYSNVGMYLLIQAYTDIFIIYIYNIVIGLYAS